MFTGGHGSTLRVMSYNIRMDTPDDGNNQWSRRRFRVFHVIRRYRPDVFGVQEALSNQVADLQGAFQSFSWYGVGRDDGAQNGEHSAIFYRKDRFELQDQGTFWLSPTPDVPGSKGWDAALPRICTWVVLRDRRSHQRIAHFNTHLDHVGKTARQEGARLIAARIREIAGPNTSTILTGDFNANPQSEAYRAITGESPLRDAKQISRSPHRGPEGTWSTFHTWRRVGDRWDYVFVSPDVQVLNHLHSTFSERFHYPSDHLPVIATLSLAMGKSFAMHPRGHTRTHTRTLMTSYRPTHLPTRPFDGSRPHYPYYYPAQYSRRYV